MGFPDVKGTEILNIPFDVASCLAKMGFPDVKGTEICSANSLGCHLIS